MSASICEMRDIPTGPPLIHSKMMLSIDELSTIEEALNKICLPLTKMSTSNGEVHDTFHEVTSNSFEDDALYESTSTMKEVFNEARLFLTSMSTSNGKCAIPSTKGHF